jgi:hypothetical protein
MKKYACAGGHSDVSHPTTLKKSQYREPRPKNSTPHQSEEGIGGADVSLTAVRFTSGSRKSEKRSKTSPMSTKSPTKKKQRRRARTLWGDIALLESSDEDGGNAHEGGVDSLPRPNRLFAEEGHDDSSAGGNPEETLGARTSAAREEGAIRRDKTSSGRMRRSTEGLSTYTTAALEQNNRLLKDRVQELNECQRNLVIRIEALSAEIAQLKVHEGRSDAAAACEQNNERNGILDNEEGVVCEEENFESTAARRKRIHVESSMISSDLSNLITDFLSRSHFSDRRKFPKTRLAKIVVNSILSFEWMHAQVAKLSSFLKGNKDCLSQLSEMLYIKQCRQNKHKAAILVDGMWANDFLDGEAKRCMIDRVRSHLRKEVFTPWKIMKAIDITGFNLSLAGIEVLRRLDVAGRYARGIIPSKSTILRSARKVEAAGDSICPFSMIGRGFRDNDDDGDIGEGFEFDVVKVTATLFDAFGLTTVAKRQSIDLALTSDGAQLTNTLSHVAAGLKFNDMAMCDPTTKHPLLLHGPDSLVQSRNLCFPLRIVIAKDNKATLDSFRPLYNQFRSGQVAEALQCRSFKMSFPGDMKLQWGALDDGGAAKVKEKFCFICPCRSSTLHVPRDKSNCDICKQKPAGDDLCYHYPFMADPEVRGKLAEELTVLRGLVQDALDADAAADNTNDPKMFVHRPGEVATADDVLDIDFQPSSANDKAVWARNITRELVKRGLPVTGTLVDRKQRLRCHLVNELRSRDVTQMLADSEPKEQAMYLVLQAVVCILHLENRVGLKSIESILRSGISNARMGLLDWITTTSVNRRQEEYVERISRIIRNEILGTPFAPSQWRFPLNEEGNMGSLSRDNNRSRLVMNSIELLIVQSFPLADVNRDLLLRCFPRYRAAIIILRKNTDATEDEIATFQDHVDAWFQDWVKVYGKEGCTNYTHMLSSSHVMRYMQEWKCLHRFSQQGWEALNALIKAYFFRRTNRGGLSKNSTRKSKLLGIARWLQRRIMWYSGNGDSVFDDSDDSSYEDNEEEEQDDDDMESFESEESESESEDDNSN